MRKNRIILLLPALLLAISAVSCGGNKKDLEAFVPEKTDMAQGRVLSGKESVENDGYLLTINGEDGHFVIKDKRTGTEWPDTPFIAETDDSMTPIKKAELQSQLIIQYINKSERTLYQNSTIGCVRKSSVEVQLLTDGFRVLYRFPGEGFVIPVEYRLVPEGFIAEVIFEHISEQKENRLISVNLLPSFGAASVSDEGYILVPDGCGALIRLNNGRAAHGEYRQQLYGRDYFQNMVFKNTNVQNASMPVYGLKKGDCAFLAVIEQGDALATVRASVSSSTFPYNLAYCEFAYRSTDSNVFQVVTRDVETRYVNLFAPRPVVAPRASVRYVFLSERSANYADMAAAYRDYLKNKKGMKPAERLGMGIQLEFIGAVQRKKTFMGVPYIGVQSLTTYEEAKTILTELNRSGICLSAVYKNWMDSGQMDRIMTQLRYSSALGGEKGFKQLQAYADAQGIRLFKAFEPLQYKKSGNGVSRLNDSIHNILDSVVYEYPFDIAVLERRKENKPTVLLSPPVALSKGESLFAAAVEDGEKRIALTSIGDMLYSDYSKALITDRWQAMEYYKRLLMRGESLFNDLMVFGANAYVYPYADSISDVPLTSSGFDIVDEVVPFMQITLKGCKNLVSTPVNLEGDYQKILLKTVEYGVTPAFVIVGGNPALLKASMADCLYSCGYSDWKDYITEIAEALNVLNANVGEAHIIAHEKLADGVCKTFYDNGHAVYVNYNDTRVLAEGVSIEKMSFKVTGGDEG